VSEHSLPQDWRLAAVCRDRVDPEVPFARSDSPELRQFIDEFCGRCPVSGECLEFALRVEDPLPQGVGRHGVFGGFTGEERLRLARRGVRGCIRCRRPFVPVQRNQVRCGRHTRDGVVTGSDAREHGSEAGFSRHRRRGEEPCALCRQARNAADRERQISRRGAA